MLCLTVWPGEFFSTESISCPPQNPTLAKTLAPRDRLANLITEENGLAPTQRYHRAQCRTGFSLHTGTWFEDKAAANM
ncbi:hypothetical protein M514_26291 [Trichuris suis]|uniref:Uncharacterized protein n=1 Tax=Trichuris suis TaxID=68888 RepID=A0A085MLR4_9BILA|nr:hypothetical protein M513_00923 [Trichuris suis]KFD61541.1 hypothetical protein M514_00923 [Trichuris suis]KFD61542.1 hypothetical protein M514_26291 [Trichuris suis]